MEKLKIWKLVTILLIVLILTACGGTPPATSNDGNMEEIKDAAPSSDQEVIPSEEDQSEEQDPSEQPLEPAPDSDEILSADRQLVEIPTSDGRTLEGYYYPSSVSNAPGVVLMHWAPGSMVDWEKIAPWLQNRPGELGPVQGGKQPYLDESWFPVMPEEVSFAVLIFNFGKYGNSEYGGSRESQVLDAQAALEFAASLPEIEPHMITAIGASIGADGVVDACYLFNDAGEKGTCVGAFSLSPGNYLTKEFSYAFAAEMVNLSGYPVWCLAAERDGASPDLCQGLSSQFNRSFIYEGNQHGMALIDPELMPVEPEIKLHGLDLMQEFLETVYGIQLNDIDLP